MSNGFPFKPFSRRHFVRGLGMGAASAAISLSAPHLLTSARAQSQQEQGFITLDAILISYLSVPPGEPESATWSFQRKYSTTFTIKSAQNPEIVFKSNVKAGSEASGIQGMQMNSSRVNSAITFFPGATGLVSTKVFDPAFFALLTPRLFVRGTPDKLRFRFDSIGATGHPYVSDPRFATNISADTAASMLARYVTDPALLVGPRFALSQTTEVPQSFSLPGNIVAGPDLTATVTSTIVGSQGFQSDVLKQAFAAGTNLELTYYSIQEVSAHQILTMETGSNRTSPVVNGIYLDRLFKTFLLT